MSFPSKADREKCWGAKDRYWQCLDSNEDNKDACVQLRAIYESACPGQWVKHFDRKHSYLKFKNKIENEGFNSSLMQETTVFQNHDHRYIPPYTKHHAYACCSNMEEVKQSGDHLHDCYNYLINLSTHRSVHLFNLKHFAELSSCALEAEECDAKLIQDCCIILLEFLEKSKKQYRLSCEIACGFCIVLSLRIQNAVQLCLAVSNVRELSVQIGESTCLLKKYSTILLAGILRFVIIYRSSSFENEDELSLFVEPVKKHIFGILSKGGDLYALLCVAESLLDLIDGKNPKNNQLLNDISSTVMCVVMNFWNHHISEVRATVYRLSIRCLKLNYEDSLKQYQQRNTIAVILNLKLFKAFANDMFWSVPYKYFAYSAGLEFLAQFSSISKFLVYVKTDLQEGFNRSLQNKRVIGSETDLFKFCTQNLSLEEWTRIFQPVVDRVISSDSVIVANNFSRYWLPVILKKYPEYAESVWNDLRYSDTNHRTAARSRILFGLLKVCHKYNIRLPVNDSNETFLHFLEKCFGDAEDTRGELFSVLCNLHEQSIVPSEHELRLILQFLRINAQSGSTILRQQIFSSFASFVLRLHCSGVKALKENEVDKLEPLLEFLNELSRFFIDGMQPSCSYQRKITSLTLYKIFMTYSVASCGGELRRNNLKDTEKFVTWLKSRESWRFTSEAQFTALFRSLMDPCGEVQNISFLLLRSYFDLIPVTEEKPLLEDVLELMRNNQFYKRQSGVVATLSMICLAYNTGPEAVRELLVRPTALYSSFTDMFLQTLRKQIGFMMKDMLYSAVYEPLDATVRVLTYLVTDITSPECEIVTESQLESLVDCLEDIVPLLLRALFVEDFADYAPSFEESDNALQKILEKSEITDQIESHNSKEDEFQLKPLYQILLNFIWISLKACCECESKLVVSKEHLDKSLVIRCCDLIVKKLKLCRHKGVIEAAGLALSDVVHVLTARNICEQWLDTTLMDVIDLIETKSSASISRKSAGLSLLIQNIVGNDKRMNKPLLTRCWSEFYRVLDIDYSKIEMDVSRELPQTHALHFLRVLIADARNSADLVPYFEDITLLCIETLKTPFWIIRNAALQLFGAILPKIVGQKNTQNDFGVRRSFEEIFSCMPRLLDHVLTSLRRSAQEDSCRLISHSNLVPLLVLLSSVQVGSVNIMVPSFRIKLLEVREHMKSLLGSELYYVRKLAGKAFISLHSKEEMTVFKSIHEEIIRGLLTCPRNENRMHGHLLMLKQAFSVYKQMACFRKKVLRNLGTRVNYDVRSMKISFMCETLLYDLDIYTLNLDWEIILTHVRERLRVLHTDRHISMGYAEWTRTILRRMLERYNNTESLVKALKICLSDLNLSIVENALITFDVHAVPKNKMKDFIDSLCECMEYHLRSRKDLVDRATILNLIFEILVRIPRYEYESIKNFSEKNYDFLRALNLFEYQANNLRTLSLFMSSSQPLKVNELLVDLRCVLDASRYNKDVRLNAVEGIKLLCYVIRENPENMNVMWTVLIQVLLDEDVDIRIIGGQCIQIFDPSVKFCSPDEAMAALFDRHFITIFLHSDIIVDTLLERIWVKDIDEYFAMMKYSNDDIANPFDQGTSNTYGEDTDIVNACGRTLYYLIIENKQEYFNASKKISDYFSTVADVARNCDFIVENKFFITAEGYRIALRIYYLLLISVELSRQNFASTDQSYRLSNLCTVVHALDSLKNCFYWQNL